MAAPSRLEVERTILVLLAAGRSERFGDGGSKLDQPLLGRPLGLHVAVTLADMPFRERIAVVARAELNYGQHGFRTVINEDPARGMASSIRLGVACAQALGADAVLIALADMPRVTAAHVRCLFDASDGPDSVVASSDGVAAKPPALFGRARFDGLLQLDGSGGARALIRSGRHVVAGAGELVDIDTPDELARLRAGIA